MKTLILNSEEVKSLLSLGDTIGTVEAAYRAFSGGNVVQPPIVSIDVEKHHGEMDFKMGYTSEDDVIGIKMAGGFWDNPKKYNLPSGVAVIVLFDAKNGLPLCVLDGTLITAYRTAAAGALAAKHLARRDSKTVAVIGTGSQARMQVRALAELFGLETVRVWGRGGVPEYVAEMEGTLPGIAFVGCESAEKAVRGADIVVTATASRTALVMDEWIAPGTHIGAIGCDMAGKQELDPAIFGRATVVHDNSKECLTRGDTQHAIAAGIITADDIHAEIGQILLGQKPGRTAEAEITIFDATGMSIQDITAALLVYKKAGAQGVGTDLDLV